jgi:hypothetical protein
MGIVGSGRTHPQGFVFAAGAEEGAMQAARAGATIRNAHAGPPWIVVDHSIESVVVAKWPGRLWRVEILEAAAEQALASANYTRAVSVKVLEEHPVSTLFGPNGHLVCRVIETASALDLEDVALLAEAVHPDSRQAYSRAWSRWLGRPASAGDEAEDHADTLAVPGNAGGRSPIGSGFTVLHSVLTGRARDLAGDAPFAIDDEGDPVFTPLWASAADAFLHAAMAQGAPELTSLTDREALTAAWAKRYGQTK